MSRIQKDDALIAAAMEELDAAEKETGTIIQVPKQTSIHGGNCEAGVIAWREKWAGGRDIVPAREMLTIAANCRDQVSRVVLGVRNAIKLALEAK